jgi:hypothetical protein
MKRIAKNTCVQLGIAALFPLASFPQSNKSVLLGLLRAATRRLGDRSEIL